MSEYKDRYDKIKKHYSEWCKFDVMNIGDKAMQSIHEKQWVISRLHDARDDREKIVKKKKELHKKVVEKISKENPIALDKKTINQIDDSPMFEDINEELKDCEFLIKYLEDLSKMLQYISQDIKNCLDSIKLDQGA